MLKHVGEDGSVKTDGRHFEAIWLLATIGHFNCPSLAAEGGLAQNDPWGDQPASPGPWDQRGGDPWRFVCCDRAEVSVVSGVPDDGVKQDPWHTEKQDKRDKTINLEAAMQMTVSMSCGKATTSEYDAMEVEPKLEPELEPEVSGDAIGATKDTYPIGRMSW